VTGTWGGLFTLSGSTSTLVAATAQQSLTSLAGNTYFTWALSASYTVPTTGIYYVGVCITAATMPTVTSAAQMTPLSSTSLGLPLQAGNLTGSLNPALIGTTYGTNASPQIIYFALT
jgi:hypothetical protein